jgi:16S rRNA (cytosine967-C5)-methyltransferase
MKHFSHLNTAVQLIADYKGGQPFSAFIKSFFAQHKKFGSKDRKTISNFCYCYFRLGHALPALSVEERMLIGLFLCNRSSVELLQHFKPDWNAKLHAGIDEKISMLHAESIPFSPADIFPWKELLSDGIDHEQFCRSFLVQPDLFLRLRPGYEDLVKQKLQAAGIGFNEISATCLSLRNTSKIDEIIELDKEAVVQDLNSQLSLTGSQTRSGVEGPVLSGVEGSVLSGVEGSAQSGTERSRRPAVNVWDCCAASGGKSILAYDLNPNIHLTVSDVRGSIIHNLKKRFAKAGIKNYRSFIADLSKAPGEAKGPALSEAEATVMSEVEAPALSRVEGPALSEVEGIICDAPCSGSGTWSRTPEQLLFFNPSNSIDHYASLQRKIASNAIQYLKPGGKFIYITCSVFKQENESAIAFLRDEFSLKIERMEILKGYDKKADTLFAASLVRTHD